MRVPTRLLLAMLLASPAAIILGSATPAFTQPPQDAQAPDDQASAQQAAPDRAADAQANPSEPPSADVDAARGDESASVDGVPLWVFDTWCSEEGYQPPTGWGISRDHTAGIRRDGRTHEGTWSVVRATHNFAHLTIDTDLGRRTLYFSRPNENDASQDLLVTPGVRFTHCGVINFNERF